MYNNSKSREELREAFIKACKKVNLKDPDLHTYKLMYYYGAWITAKILVAEDDYEAIFDADREEKKGIEKLRYALFNEKGEIVKKYFDEPIVNNGVVFAFRG